MKKLLINLCCIIGFFNANSVLATNKVGVAVDQGVGVVFQFDGLNALISHDSVSGDYINVFLGGDGMSADYIFQQGTFSEQIAFSWYIGTGMYYNWDEEDEFGARIPLGITLPFAPQWDIYTQLGPLLNVNLDNDNVDLELDFSLGVRYEF